MITAFQQAAKKSGADLSLGEWFATAALVTAVTITKGFTDAVGDSTSFSGEVICSGGGMHNQAIRRLLKSHLRKDARAPTDLGVPGDAKEAMAFALLGAATLEGIPSNVPSATGARRAVVLGSITPKP